MRYNAKKRDTKEVLVDAIESQGSFKKEELIKRAARNCGKTKTAYILEAVDEKLDLTKSREQIIRELAGWLSHKEAEKLRKSTKIFNKVNQEDWD